jgi:cell fate regulator YaaT (PSP1 superfamily)
MAEVVGVRFKTVGKVYYFDPDGNKLKKGDKVIVETARGVECGEIAMENRQISDEELVQPLKKLIRVATADDMKRVEENHRKEKSAFQICLRKIAAHKLEMKLVDVEYTFDNSKILFYFTADGRVDFRELVKDLASVFPHPHRTSPDRRARRGENAGRNRGLRPAVLLLHIPRRVSACLH